LNEDEYNVMKCNAVLCVTDSSSSSSSSSAGTTSVTPLTPSTHQKLSQAILDIFRSFGDVQRRLAIPRGTLPPPPSATLSLIISISIVIVIVVIASSAGGV